MFDHERTWALYAKSTGGTHIMVWYANDLDTFEYDGVIYTRVGETVCAYTQERAAELLRAAQEAHTNV